MSKIEQYPNTLYVIRQDGPEPPIYQGRLDQEHLPIGGDIVRIAQYKLVRQLEVRRQVVVRNEIG